MNERIKELAEQAGFYFYDLHNVNGEDLGETIESDDWLSIERFAALVIEDYKSPQQKVIDDTMRDDLGNMLRVIWEHPDLDGQYVSGYTRREAQSLVKAIVQQDLSEDGFVRTGKYHYNGRIFSGDIYEKVKNAPAGHFLENW